MVENKPKLKVQGFIQFYFVFLCSHKLCPWSGSILRKAPVIVICICPSICSSQLCNDSCSHFSRPVLKGVMCGRKSSGELARDGPRFKPKRTLEEFLRRDNVTTHLKGVGRREEWCLRGQKPRRFSSSHLYIFKADVEDKIVSITDFPIIFSK